MRAAASGFTAGMPSPNNNNIIFSSKYFTINLLPYTKSAKILLSKSSCTLCPVIKEISSKEERISIDTKSGTSAYTASLCF